MVLEWKRTLSVLATVALMVVMVAMPASAQPVFTGGLVNVTVGGVQVGAAVPIGIAAQVCPNVNAAALAQDLEQDGEATCEADQETLADNRAFQNVAF